MDRTGARHEAVERLRDRGVGAEEARSLVAAALRDHSAAQVMTLQGRPLVLDDPVPWPDQVDGNALLADIVATLAPPGRIY